MRCDGTCSVATPRDFGQACNSCNGRVLCNGNCSTTCACQPGAIRCNPTAQCGPGHSMQQCAGDGSGWTTFRACNFICQSDCDLDDVGGSQGPCCTGNCVPGTFRCNFRGDATCGAAGNRQERCDCNGFWVRSCTAC